jgi:cytochrome c556
MTWTLKTNACLALGLAVSVLSAAPATAGDDRELVKLPQMMQEHMLANMRDHLAALDEMLADLADGETDKAAEVAENRLGMSSLSLHGAETLGKFMPAAMGELGTQMHRAASRFVIVAQDAELEPSKESQRKVYSALRDVTANCNACHQAYRIR